MRTPVPQGLLAAVRKANTFANPEYVRQLSSGRRSYVSPTVTTLREIDGWLHIPRGFGKRLHAMAGSMGIVPEWLDCRVESPATFPARLREVSLRDYQERAVRESLIDTQGVIVSPTASGKTITALELIRRRGQKAVVLVHARELARQWREVIRARLGVEPGMIGDGQWLIGQQITVATIQTLASRPEATTRLARSVGLVLVDECHHIPAETFAEVIGLFPARYRYGFTATPDRGDGLGDIIHRLLGDVVATVEAGEVLDIGGIVPAIIQVVPTGIQAKGIDPAKHGWSEFVSAITADAERNRLIAATVRKVANRRTLILTDRVEHAEELARLLPGAVLVHGKLPAAKRAAAMSAMLEAQITVGTKGLLGEGVDCSVWSCLAMACPMSGETPLRQAVGRVIRPAPGKKDGLTIDFLDDHPFAYGAFRKRRVVYNSQKWRVTNWRG
ncbi:MAG: DEAD/DEAH box helicase [Magnetococcales bacterium]|nr:DEAD/DEAH box helicase [Magnetococcales bacterium]